MLRCNFLKKLMKTLWDNLYVPIIKGYFTSEGRFRSDDVKTGDILAYTASSASSVYFPKEVIISDREQHAITDIVCRLSL